MRSKIAAAAVAMSLLVSGCSGADKAMCEASLKESLLNPETAEFYDFTSISKSDAGRMVAGDLASDYDGAAATAVSEETQSQFDRKMDEQFPNAKFYRLRVRAEGPLGNTITKNQMCTVIDEGCLCVDGQ